ncbi:GTP cyclohydrolase FolE2 [Ampullimonas aquatilis]|uniref:GTP cyclohydrolase FolE2 n=1 Tax=Ampullimonas aquatilis TaxID=1341549 RepID=UPI003C76BDAA
MNAPEKIFLPDVQSNVDQRNLPIQRVGVKSIVHPISVATADGGVQHTVANIDMYVALPSDVKGTHMSRFLEILQQHDAPLSMGNITTMMSTMLQRLEANAGYIELRMPYFVKKTAPVSSVQSLMDYQVAFCAEYKKGVLKLTQQVMVPVTSLCPCSKNISDYGAHNQRSHITIAAEVVGDITIEELIRMAEMSASCELWGLLKRPDEKYVTERAYENPKFVEDLVRDIALLLNADERVIAYTLESENFESIHNHSAYALIEHDKRVAVASASIAA